MGNNEVVGPYGAGTVFGRQAPPLWLLRASIALKATRTGQLLDRCVAGLTHSRGTPQTWAGMEMFTDNRLAADDPRLRRAYLHFSANLGDILRAANRAGAKVILCTVATNLKDCAPFASLNRGNWTKEEQNEWERRLQAGQTAEAAGKPAVAAAAYAQAARLDNGHAETLFRWARCELARSNQVLAAQLFAKARDHDALRFRADTRINDLIRRAAGGHRTNELVLVDAEQILNGASVGHIAGSEFFYEHVHFNSAGNYLLARNVAEAATALLPELAAQDPRGPWLTAEQCSERLAFTDWSQLEIARILQDRVGRLPFTLQWDHAAHQRQLRLQILDLQTELTPKALARLAHAYEPALAAAPDDWVLLESLSRLLRFGGDALASAAAAEHVTRLLPHRPEGWLEYGLALEQLGRSTEAEAALKEALRLQPNEITAMCALGRVRLRQERFNEALTYFSEALYAQPKSEDAVLGLAESWTGLGDRAKALAQFQKVLELNPAHPVARSNVLAVLNSEGQLTKEIELLENAARADPRDPVVRLSLGKALFRAGRLAEAAPHFVEAVALAPELSEGHYYLGLDLVRQEQLDGAQVQFAEAVRLQPEDATSRLNYGVCLARARRFTDAIGQFEAVLRLQPDNAVARHYLELARSQSGRTR